MIATLHVLTSLDPKNGGIGQAVRSIIRYASDRNIRHEVLCLDNTNADFIKECDFKVYALGKGVTAWNFSSKLEKWLNEYLYNYDRIVVHGLWQYQSYVVYNKWKSIKNKNIRLYVMPHGMLDPYFQKAKGRKIKALRNILFWNLVEKHIVNNADCLLFTCETEEILAWKTFRHYQPNETLVVSLGIEAPPPFSGQIPQRIRNLHASIIERGYFLFLGRIHTKKGVDLLVRAYKRLKMDMGGVPVPVLVIAGPGVESSFGRMLLTLTNGDKDIMFPGMLYGSNKWDAFYGCEAFVLPSHQENFGIAVVEAMACGKAVLISKQINICVDIVEDNAGIVAEDTFDGTFNVLKDWMKLSITNRAEYGINAKFCYDKRYSGEFTKRTMLLLLK